MLSGLDRAPVGALTLVLMAGMGASLTPRTMRARCGDVDRTPVHPGHPRDLFRDGSRPPTEDAVLVRHDRALR